MFYGVFSLSLHSHSRGWVQIHSMHINTMAELEGERKREAEKKRGSYDGRKRWRRERIRREKETGGEKTLDEGGDHLDFNGSIHRIYKS